ncbi:MAG: hypothetical protein ACYSWP_21105 [Planctomycetota bacterium]|jgi:hypothetical protein
MAKKATKETALEKKEAAPLATAMDFSAFGATGFEDCGTEDYSIPFINIIQANSPMVDEANAEYDPDAKKGEIFNSVTGQRWDGKTGIVIQPVYRDHKFLEYIDRDSGGGFVGSYDPEDPVVLKAKEESTEYGKYKVGDHELVETFSLYCNILSDDGEEYEGQAIISFTSTKIKVYKKIMGAMNTFMLPTPDGRKAVVPIFANRLRVTTGTQTNKGKTSYNYHIAPLHGSLKDSFMNPATNDLVRLGYEFHKLAKAGDAKVDYTKTGEDKAGAGGAEAKSPF